MNRRSFLTVAAASTLSILAGGCGQRRRQTLTVKLLKNSVPSQLLGKFRREFQIPPILQFSSESQLQDLFALLQHWQRRSQDNPDRPIAVPDLVLLGDYWLTQAIEQGLVKPLDPSQLPLWWKIPAEPLPWRSLVTRDPQGQFDASGAVWGAPYRWGSTVIAYRTDKFETLGWTPKDWSDLWKPELRHRISLPDNAREVIGLTLKKLGYSYNTDNLNSVPELETELAALHQQVKLYSSDAYLQPLLLKDTWVAVGPSADILALPQFDRQIAAVVPQSGTSLWADLWVRPVGAVQEESDPSVWAQWIDFCWQPEIAKQLSLVSDGVSPILAGTNPTELSEALRQNSVLLPDREILQRSEFLTPLSDEAIEEYRQLWVKVRSSI